MTKKFTLTTINEFTYDLKINGEYSNFLYSTIRKIIKTAHVDHDTNSLIITSEKIIPYKAFLLQQTNKRLTHKTCVKFLDDLTKQILYLKQLGMAFYGFDIDDILVVYDTFIFCSTQHLLPLETNNKTNIVLTTIIKMPYFSNPELYKLTSLPEEINYKSCYYSLGVLIVFSLLNNYLLVGNEIKTSEEIDKIIQPLYNTKIYWFIKRCLEPDVHKRKLLLI